jgi:Zn-dependent membrane protease YugP
LTGFFLVMVLGAVVSGVAALWVRSSYSRWSKRISTSGLSGAEVARAILDRNGLWKVRVEPVAGTLTDHYDPSRKAVRLSEGNFRGSSLAAVSVAAHECGHAIQDGTGYLPMKLRAGLLPIVNLGAQLWFPLFFAGIVMGGAGLGQLFMQLSVLAFAGVLAFHVVTLPVEFDASRRAYGLLTRYGLLSRRETGGTKRVLTAAAFTYVAAALTSLLTLLYLILVSRE